MHLNVLMTLQLYKKDKLDAMFYLKELLLLVMLWLIQLPLLRIVSLTTAVQMMKNGKKATVTI